jgi:hypothetical protein
LEESWEQTVYRRPQIDESDESIERVLRKCAASGNGAPCRLFFAAQTAC